MKIANGENLRSDSGGRFKQKITRALLHPGILLWLILTGTAAANPAGNIFAGIRSDRARYAPGDTVHFRADFQSPLSGYQLRVIYSHLGTVLSEAQYPLTGTQQFNWEWQPPADDFRGYLAEAALMDGDSLLERTAIAVDVSSDWRRFPRYGFLSKYSYMNQGQMEAVIERLNRHHINGLQFYDWHHKHHKPLKGTAANPAPSWNDIANRTNYFATVDGYIRAAHEAGMMAMSYNLLYGAWEDAHLDGVSPAWRLFKDGNHQQPDYHDLPSSWASDIYLMDPGNALWKDYIFSATREAFAALDFDGWHVDQLGDRGTLFTYDGQPVFLAGLFHPFLRDAKDSLAVRLVMNAVNQYGQSGIAVSPVDFLYTEVWGPNDSYNDLASIVKYNAFISSGKNSVLAAYVNRGLSGSPGPANTPAVLLADAVIFASGGAHLELGEHLLCNEYFPNSNLDMSQELQERLLCYYDFLVAYQNLLRDGGNFNNLMLHSSSGVQVKAAAQQGTVWGISRRVGQRQVFHLINFTDAATMNWADNGGIQAEPGPISGIRLSFPAQETVSRVWWASPDREQGIAAPINYTQQNDSVSFTLPALKYWSMVVVEYDSSTALLPEPDRAVAEDFQLSGNYPNPFNGETAIEFTLLRAARVRAGIYDLLGRQVAVAANRRFSAGLHRLRWRPGGEVSSGLYVCRLRVDEKAAGKIRMLYVK